MISASRVRAVAPVPIVYRLSLAVACPLRERVPTATVPAVQPFELSSKVSVKRTDACELAAHVANVPRVSMFFLNFVIIMRLVLV